MLRDFGSLPNVGALRLLMMIGAIGNHEIGNRQEFSKSPALSVGNQKDQEPLIAKRSREAKRLAEMRA